MSLIKNLVVEPENKPSRNRKGKNSEEDVSEEDNKPRPIVKSATDLQRLRLEKLMKNPDKPIVIPEPPSEKDYMQTVPTFVRNVMGSSAGAGSGEFHVYRHLRRKEYARQKTIQAKSMREQLDDEYQEKLNENKRIAEEKTAKKRAKRQKKKQRAKKPREQKQQSSNGAEDCEKNNETSDEDDEEEVDRLEKPNVVEELKDEEVTPQNDHEKKITEELEVCEKSNEDVVSEVAGPNIPEKSLEQKNDDSKEKTNKEETEKIANTNEATTIENSPKTTAVEEENDVIERND